MAVAVTGFAFRTVHAPVADAHAAAFPDPLRREVWFVEPTDAAVVLGSTQPLSALDLGEVARRGLAVVRRHSGGGAVVVDSKSLTWFDVWLPAEDEQAVHDVTRAADWLAEAVIEALGLVGIAGVAVDPATTDPAEMRSRWARLVCFAGPGAGEVLVSGRKAVGISQRRTRAGARFQVMVLHHLDPEETVSLFALEPNERAQLAAHLGRSVYEVDVDRVAVRTALEQALSTR